MRALVIAPTLALLVGLAPALHARAPDHPDPGYRDHTCPDPASAPTDVEATIRAFFDALRLADQAPFRRLTTQGFYAFDVGARFPDAALAVSVRGALDRGVEIIWNLGPMDMQVRCDVAWAQWENVGSVGMPGEAAPVRWLESAVLVHEGGGWKLDFFHSQRAKAP